MPVITIPKPLRDRLGDEATEALANIIREIDDDARKDALVIAEEKFERRLAEEAGKIHTKIAETESRLIKWMFIFWVGQIAVISGIVFTFLKMLD